MGVKYQFWFNTFPRIDTMSYGGKEEGRQLTCLEEAWALPLEACTVKQAHSLLAPISMDAIIL